MKIPFKMILPTLATAICFAFASGPSNNFIGTFGVPDADPAQIKLTINADQTFYYQEFSSANNKVAINGNWRFDGKKLILTDSEKNTHKFHNVWRFTENGNVAKSRSGLSFYRLCRIDVD